MIEFVTANLLGIATGIVIAKLVYMPFIDEPIKDAWSWVWRNTLGRL